MFLFLQKRSAKSNPSARTDKRAKLNVAADVSNVNMQVPIQGQSDDGLSQMCYTLEDGTVTYLYVERSLKEKLSQLLNKPPVSETQSLEPSTQQQDGDDNEDGGESTEVESVSSEDEQPTPICHSTMLTADPIQKEGVDVLPTDAPTVNITECQSSTLTVTAPAPLTKTPGIGVHKPPSTQVNTAQNNLVLSGQTGKANYPNAGTSKEEDGPTTESAPTKNILNNAVPPATMVSLANTHPGMMYGGSYSSIHPLSALTSCVNNKTQGPYNIPSDFFIPNWYTTLQYTTTQPPVNSTTTPIYNSLRRGREPMPDAFCTSDDARMIRPLSLSTLE